MVCLLCLTGKLCSLVSWLINKMHPQIPSVTRIKMFDKSGSLLTSTMFLPRHKRGLVLSWQWYFKNHQQVFHTHLLSFILHGNAWYISLRSQAGAALWSFSEYSKNTIFKCCRHMHIAGDLQSQTISAYATLFLDSGVECHFRVQCVSLTKRWCHASALGAYPPYHFNWTAAQDQDSYTRTDFLESDGYFIVTNMGEIY